MKMLTRPTRVKNADKLTRDNHFLGTFLTRGLLREVSEKWSSLVSIGIKTDKSCQQKSYFNKINGCFE